MKWFKHHSDASRGETIQKIFNKYGLEGEARFWRLVELLSFRYEGGDAVFSFTMETIRQSLRHRSATDCRLFLDHLATISGLKVEYSGNDCLIKYDKILEIKDNHHRNLQVTGNKLAPRRDIDIERDKDIYIKQKLTPDDVLNLWNTEFAKDGQHLPGLGSGKHLMNCLESIKYLDSLDKWRDIFLKATSNEFLTSGSDNWRVNITWLVDYDNILKVVGGNYTNNGASNDPVKDFLKRMEK